MEAKLDKVLSAIQPLTNKIDSLESKLSIFEHKYDTLNEKILEQDETITVSENRFKKKVDEADYFNLLKRIEDIEKEVLLRESYGKRLNLVIHGLKEKNGLNKETKTKTREIFDNFVVEGFQLDTEKITLVDIHRLSQHQITKNGKRVTRPIIIKLANAMDKHYIMKNVKHLKTYNESLNQTTFEPGTSFRAKSMTKSDVFITDHLPQKFYEQKWISWLNLRAAGCWRSNPMGVFLTARTAYSLMIKKLILDSLINFFHYFLQVCKPMSR